MSDVAKKKPTVYILKDEMGLKPSAHLVETMKKQTEIKTKIMQSLKEGAKTLPEIAKNANIDQAVAFWYLMTMFKYGEVEEVGKNDEGYFLYRLKARK
ncbi:MAG: hypothetical protein ACP5I2_03355 [Fervidicoccaceae archaeon]